MKDKKKGKTKKRKQRRDVMWLEGERMKIKRGRRGIVKEKEMNMDDRARAV